MPSYKSHHYVPQFLLRFFSVDQASIGLYSIRSKRTPVALDDARRAREELPAMARSQVEGAGRETARVFFADTVDPFVPCPAA